MLAETIFFCIFAPEQPKLTSNMRIKELLKEKGITQKELATRMGISEGNLSNILSGKFAPTLSTLESIAEAIGVEVAELFAPTIKCPHCGQSIVVTGVTSVNDK